MRRTLLNNRYGSWVVLEEKSFRNHTKVLCLCDCGVQKWVWKSHLTCKKSQSCGCKSKVSGNKNPNWKGFGGIPLTYWTNLRKAALGLRGRREIGISIDIEYAWSLFIAQNRCCSLSGVLLSFEEDKTASLDRIDSTIGYHEGNVQWVHKDINKMKGILSQEDFIKWCKLVGDTCEV